MSDEILDDFNRETWCLLGLVYDAVDLGSAIEIIRQSARVGRKCVISTPNVNFTIAARSDPEFRKSVINSDLSLVDGMPLFWLSRFIGCTLPEKVSGSDLFHSIWQNKSDANESLKVFLFGGMEGIAERACHTLESSSGGLSCAGFHNPGFGSVEDLGRQEVINKINESGADFLVIALGSKKGQLWIDRYRDQLTVPVVSHLGAVLNFVAGNIKRAPFWMQRTGLEWLWRILQEPGLWRRYLVDGFCLLGLIVTRILPYAIWQKRHKKLLRDREGVTWSIDANHEEIIISISGACLHDTIAPLRPVFSRVANRGKRIELNLSDVPVADGAFIGLCLILDKHVTNSNGTLSISGLNPEILRIFRWNCVEYLI